MCFIPIRKYIVLLIITLFPLVSLAQENNVLELLDSLYWEREFKQIISISEDNLESENDLYNEVGLNYYRANANYRIGNFKEALQLTEENYKRSQELPVSDTSSVRFAIDASQKLGDYSFQADKYAQGIYALKRGIQLNEKYLNNDDWRLVKLYHKLGAVLRIANKYDESKEKLQHGINTIIPRLSESNKGRITPVYQAEMAELHSECNQPQKAIAIYKNMIKVAEETENIARVSIYNNNCGLAYLRLRDFPKAKHHFQKNLEANLEWQGPKSTRMITSFTNLANVNTQLQNDEEAKEYFQKAVDLIIEVLGEDNLRLSDLYFTIGNYHLNHDELDKALAAFQKSISIREKQNLTNDLNTTNAYQMAGKTLVELGKIDEGISFLNTAAEDRSITNLKQDANLGITYSYLYDAYIKKDKLQEAKQALDNSFDAVEYDFENPLAFEKVGIPSFLITPLEKQIDYYSRIVGTKTSVIKEGEKTIDIATELMKYLRYNLGGISSRQILVEDCRPLNDAIIDFYFQAYQKSKNEEYINRAFSTIEKSSNTFLYENLAEDGKNAYKLPEDIINRKNKIHSEISQNQENITSISSEDPKYNSFLTKLNQSHEDLYALIEEIRIDHSEYYNTIYNFPIIDINTTQAALKDEEVFVSYYFGPKDLYAISIDKSNIGFTKLGKSERTKSQIRNLITNLKSKGEIEKIKSEISDLHTSIFAPLELNTYKRIFLCRDDILGLLPFEVFNLYSGHYNDNQTIAYQYSATLMNAPNNLDKSGYGVLAMAPVFEDNHNGEMNKKLFVENIRGVENTYLPETENEANIIGDLFSGTVLLKAEATVSQFRDRYHGKSILHLATHGYADQKNSNKSCLYFTKSNSTEESGHLLAEEIAQMKINADLVTLSACNTGIGKIQEGEGVASLGRAFAYADCPNQVLSLWSVNDKTTTELMSYFYTNLKEGQTKAKALSNAKSQYLASAPEILKHPYYWAGFIYYGSDSVLNQNSHTKKLVFMGLIGIGLLVAGLFLKYKK